MLQTLNWPSLEKCRKTISFILLFKLLNNVIYIPTEYLPVPSPLTSLIQGQITIESLYNCLQEQTIVKILFYQGRSKTGIILKLRT